MLECSHLVYVHVCAERCKRASVQSTQLPQTVTSTLPESECSINSLRLGREGGQSRGHLGHLTQAGAAAAALLLVIRTAQAVQAVGVSEGQGQGVAGLFDDGEREGLCVFQLDASTLDESSQANHTHLEAVGHALVQPVCCDVREGG